MIMAMSLVDDLIRAFSFDFFTGRGDFVEIAKEEEGAATTGTSVTEIHLPWFRKNL